MILNLTQHVGSPEQQAEGLVDLEGSDLSALKKLLTFSAEDVRKVGEIVHRARMISGLALVCLMDVPAGHKRAMIGGLPALMGPLVQALQELSIEPMFSHSDRVSVDMPDGTKVSKFAHQFFYPAP